MIQEDYVSFETAKLLKEKGFDGASRRMFRTLKGYPAKFYDLPNWTTNIDLNDTCQNCEFAIIPTLQMAMKWLRNNFNINPVPYALSLGWAFDIFDLSDRDITGCKKLYSMDLPSKSEVYNTYEEAAEAAIKYCLENLI